MYKSLKYLVATIVCAVALAIPAFAALNLQAPTLRPDTYVYDQSELFSPDAIATVNTRLADLQRATSVDFAVITIRSLEGMDSGEYATSLANQLQIGDAELDTGLLMLISKFDNKVYIAVGRGLEGLLNDAKVGRFLDKYFVPYRTAGDYDHALTETVNAIATLLEENADDIKAGKTVASDSTFWLYVKAFLFIGGPIILLWILMVKLNKHGLLGIVADIASSSSGRGRWGGGFGSGGSGGGGHSIGGGGSFGGGGAGR
jgi:uncharacterized protein